MDHSRVEPALPAPDASWSETNRYAAAFDGYGYWGMEDAAAVIANSAYRSFEDGGRNSALLGTLSLAELRTCLFFEHRRHHWTGWVDLPYIRVLLTCVRAKLAAGIRLGSDDPSPFAAQIAPRLADASARAAAAARVAEEQASRAALLGTRPSARAIREWVRRSGDSVEESPH